jgi:hypothetical protein
MSKIVVGYVAPILLRNVRLHRLEQTPPTPPSQVMANVDHPITKELMENLPKMLNPDLALLRAMLTDPERGGFASASSQEDVDSWVGLVDLEIEHRRSEGSRIFQHVVGLFRRRTSGVG